MDKISPQDIALFKNVTLQDDNTAKTFIFRYSNVDTAIVRYFESQEPESSNSTTAQTNNNSTGPSTNSNTFLQARSSLPKNEFSRPATEPTTAPTTEKKNVPRETINIDDDSLDEDFDPNHSDELDEPAQDPFEKIKSTLFSAIQSGVSRMLNDNVTEFIAVSGATEAVAKSYLARYGSTARALDEYFVRDTGEDQVVANNNSNSVPIRANVIPVPQVMFNPLMNFMNREPVKRQRKNKERSEHSALALRLRGNYDAYVKKHLKPDLVENNSKEWPKFLGSLLVECRINTQELLSKVKIRDEVRFEPEEVEYTSTNITKKQKNSEGISTKVVVGKNWYIKGSSLLVRCIWKNQFVGYLNCEYEEAFVFLLSKKYIFVEGVIVDCPEVSKNGDFSVHGNNQFRGFSGFNKIKVQLDIFMTEQVITNPLNIIAIPGRRRGGVKSTRSAKTQDDEIEDSKEAQQMYQMLRLAKESFVKLFKMLELKVTIPTVVQVRHRVDPFQRIKREKYGFKARGRGRYFMNSSGAAAEVLTEDFKEYYKSPKLGENGTGVNRAQTLANALNRLRNEDLNSEDDEDDDDFDDDLIEEYEDEDMDSDDSDRPRMRRMNTTQPSLRRMSTQFEDSKGQNENSKQNQDLFGSTNQISSYYKATEPPETLKSTLHLYQKQALSWMQYREGLMEREELFETKLEEHRLLNDLFQEMTLLDGSKIYFNPFNGEISVDFPTLKACKGGILADEMGLGKTVMTIALIHAHNRKTLKQKKLEENDESEEEEDDESEDSDESEEEDEDDDLEVKPKPRRARRGKARQAKKKPLKGTLDNFVKVKRIPAMNKKRQAENDLSSDDEGDFADDKEKDEDFEVSEIVTSKKKLKVDNKKAKNVGKKASNAAKKPTPSKAKASQSKDNKGKGAKKESSARVIQGGTLIVLPLTVLSQWEAEIKKHSKANTLSVLQYYGGGREKYNLEDYDVVLTTYGTLETECSKQQKDTPSVLFDCQWFRVILDEAHYIKGRTTKTTKAACSLQAEYRWCLTGTPLQNRLDDMFSLMQFLKVDTWGEYFWWNTYINKYTSHDEAANLIRGILKPLILRRTKKSTYLNGSNILDLPGKEIKSHFVKLTHEERAIYNCFFQGSKQQFNDLVANGSIQYEYAHIFELLIRLRQVCDHPSMVFSKDDLKNRESLETAVYKFLEKRMPIGGTMPTSNKQDSLKKILTGPKEGEGEEKMEEENSNSMMQSEFIQKTLERLKNKELEPCCICLEEITDPAIAKCGHIFCKTCLTLSLNNSKKCPLCQNEISLKDVMSISLEDQDRCRDLLDSNAANFKKSSKLAAVIDAVHDVAKKGEKVVIFSQFIGMLNLIERFFKEESIEYRRIDGSSTMKERTKRIDDFNQEKKVTAFLISLKAGAIGLNLTVATNVFLVDPWWNPAIEDQAIERVHRIGQKSSVNVVRFVCEKTIEERIQQLNAQKKDMINKILQFNPQEQKKQNLDNMIYVMRGFDDE